MEPIIDQIKPETLAVIRSHAKQLGISADEYLRRLLPAEELELGLRPGDPDDDFEADMSAFVENVHLPQSNSGTFSRKDIYADHD